MKHPSRTRIAEDNLALVYSIAAQVSRAIGHTIEIDELASYGTLGLLQALDRFDPARGVKWSSYAHHRIRGAIWDGVRHLCPVPSHQFRAHRGRGAAVKVQPLQPERVGADLPRADDALAARQLHAQLDESVKRLPRDERELLHRHYWQEESLLDFGARKGFTKSWASKRHSRAIDRLRGAMAPVRAAA